MTELEVSREKSAAEKAAEVLLSFGWLLFFLLMCVSPVLVYAVWKALL
jgi:hypothetical protein